MLFGSCHGRSLSRWSRVSRIEALRRVMATPSARLTRLITIERPLIMNEAIIMAQSTTRVAASPTAGRNLRLTAATVCKTPLAVGATSTRFYYSMMLIRGAPLWMCSHV